MGASNACAAILQLAGWIGIGSLAHRFASGPLAAAGVLAAWIVCTGLVARLVVSWPSSHRRMAGLAGIALCVSACCGLWLSRGGGMPALFALACAWGAPSAMARRAATKATRCDADRAVASIAARRRVPWLIADATMLTSMLAMPVMMELCRAQGAVSARWMLGAHLAAMLVSALFASLQMSGRAEAALGDALARASLVLAIGAISSAIGIDAAWMTALGLAGCAAMILHASAGALHRRQRERHPPQVGLLDLAVRIAR